MVDCPDCGSTHLGSRCGMTFRQRLRTVRLDSSVTETRTRHRYFDSAALDESFGADRKDRYWDETEGQGAIVRDGRGGFVHTDHTGETKPASPELIASYIEGPEVDPASLNEGLDTYEVAEA